MLYWDIPRVQERFLNNSNSIGRSIKLTQFGPHLTINYGPWTKTLKAVIPVYLANTNNKFNRVLLYCGYVPTTHPGLVASIDAIAPIETPAMVFSGENDVFFAPLASEQASKFLNPVQIHSSVAGHVPPYSTDSTFDDIVDFIRAGLD